MTLILTHLSAHGIIHASDSNLSTGSGNCAGVAQKTFEIKHLTAGLTVAGCYSVAGCTMDFWMSDFIQRHSLQKNATLSCFAEELRASLEDQMTRGEKKGGSLVHIAGYARNGGSSHPEFHFVRNTHGLDQRTGEYIDFREQFLTSEDFWTRDCPRSNLMRRFQDGAYQLYVNGFASGRIGFMAVQDYLAEFFRAAWSHPSWSFRPPRSLPECEAFAKLYMNVVSTLFQVSDYSAPFVGGDTQVLGIPAPPDVVRICV